MGSCLENGVFLGALSSLFFSLCSLVVKSLTDLHPLQLSWFSFLGIVIVSGFAAVHRKDCLFPPEHRKLLFGRSIAGTLFLLSSFCSVQLLPLGDASVLFYTAPAFTVILAKWLIKEPCSFRNTILLFVMMVCVVLVMKPPFIFGATEVTKEYLLGVMTAIAASLSDSLGNVALRDLRTLHYSVILFNYGLFSLIQTTIISLAFSKFTLINIHQFMLITLLVILNSGEQVLMTLALKFEKAGPVALAQASDIIYGYAFQIIFFNEPVDLCSIVGAIIISIIIIFMSIDRKKDKKHRLILVY